MYPSESYQTWWVDRKWFHKLGNGPGQIVILRYSFKIEQVIKENEIELHVCDLKNMIQFLEEKCNVAVA
jgi:hypothetical protein